IDIFPTTLDYPVRVEFWGDEVTDIRQFSIADQRTIPEIEVGSVEIFPARELPITEAIAQRAETLAVKHPGNAALVELLSKVSQRMASEGMEALLPVLSDAKMVPLTDFRPEGTPVVRVEPEKIRTRIADLEFTDAEFMDAGWEAGAMGADGPLATKGMDTEASSYRSYESLEKSCEKAGLPQWTFAPTGM